LPQQYLGFSDGIMNDALSAEAEVKADSDSNHGDNNNNSELFPMNMGDDKSPLALYQFDEDSNLMNPNLNGQCEWIDEISLRK
jgi:hypothetical protein